MNPASGKEKVLCTAAELAEATGGRLLQGRPETSCRGVSTDSRHPRNESLFIALRGESFDGARFCRQAIESGSRIVLVNRLSWEQENPGPLPASCAVVAVEDTLRALGELAAWHRRRFAVHLTAITGSNGKTSTKQLAVAVLGGSPAVLFNHGNLNNLVGMPRALLDLDSSHQQVVMEMGMNAPGEIRRLAEIAAPQTGLITNVHPVHLEGLGSIQAVAEAKGELFESLPASGTAVVNVDDPYVLRVAGRTRARQVTFGRSPAADIRLVGARAEGTGLELELAIGGRPLHSRLERPGIHNAMNAAAAAAVGLVEGVPVESIADRLAVAQFPRLRMERLDLGSAHLLVDCYNANPRSMQAALQTLQEIAGSLPKFAVLGEMRELGRASEELHLQLGQAAAQARLAGLCTFGSQTQAIARGAREAGLDEVAKTESVEVAVSWVQQRLGAEAWVLLKGSRAMKMERIVSALAQRFGVAWDWGHEE